jgi:hypothetical protein
MSAYVDKSTLKKFFKAANPFAVKPAPPNPSDEPDAPGRKDLFAKAFALFDRADELLLAARAQHERDNHKHSFSCPCNVCDAETARLTLARLKSQGA